MTYYTIVPLLSPPRNPKPRGGDITFYFRRRKWALRERERERDQRKRKRKRV
jgi:hypothetical protein